MSCAQRCLSHFGNAVSHWRILEPGCGDGRQTISLVRAARFVLCVEPRLHSVWRLRERLCGLSFSNWAILQQRADDLSGFHGFDLLFHCGLFYHLHDPVTHWHRLAERFSRIWLNTHYARADEAKHHWQGYAGGLHREPVDQPRAGLDALSFWLSRPALLRLIGETHSIRVMWEEEDHPNGPRIELLCER